MVRIKKVPGKYNLFPNAFIPYFKENQDKWVDFTAGIPVEIPKKVFEELKKSFDLPNMIGYCPEVVSDTEVRETKVKDVEVTDSKKRGRKSSSVEDNKEDTPIVEVESVEVESGGDELGIG